MAHHPQLAARSRPMRPRGGRALKSPTPVPAACTPHPPARIPGAPHGPRYGLASADPLQRGIRLRGLGWEWSCNDAPPRFPRHRSLTQRCLRQHPERAPIDLKQRLAFLDFCRILTALADQLAQDFYIVASGLCLCVNVLDIGCERLLFFFKPLDALHDAAQPIRRDTASVVAYLAHRSLPMFG